MKKIFIIAFILLTGCTSYQQSSVNRREYFNLPAPQNDLYNASMYWLAERYPGLQARVIQEKNRDDGVIIGIGRSFELDYCDLLTIEYFIVIEAKDNKIRFQLHSPTIIRNGTPYSASHLEPVMIRLFRNIKDDYQMYVKARIDRKGKW